MVGQAGAELGQAQLQLQCHSILPPANKNHQAVYLPITQNLQITLISQKQGISIGLFHITNICYNHHELGW